MAYPPDPVKVVVPGPRPRGTTRKSRAMRLYQWLIFQPVRVGPLERAFVWWINRRFRRRRA